uniref:Uncharacterized protein n=1 Tax=Toxoplasma gondii COUG TaxID=1074873 RepID=A0A2G8Y1K5_TOXGO|nr:hypothetical protein TGCOUG_269775 [Toxoplasma gondii COUG]
MITRLLSANSSPKVTHFRGVLSANVLCRLSIKTVGRDNIMFSGCKSLFQSHFIHFRGVQPRCNEGTTATKSQLRASVLPQTRQARFGPPLPNQTKRGNVPCRRKRQPYQLVFVRPQTTPCRTTGSCGVRTPRHTRAERDELDPLCCETLIHMDKTNRQVRRFCLQRK